MPSHRGVKLLARKRQSETGWGVQFRLSSPTTELPWWEDDVFIEETMVEKEKRKHKRIEVSVLLDLRTPYRTVSLGRGCVVNLSLGGLCVETTADFDPLLLLDLRIPLSEDVSFDVLGEVVWKRVRALGFTYGVRFTDIGFGMRRKLNKYILARLVESATEGLKPRPY